MKLIKLVIKAIIPASWHPSFRRFWNRLKFFGMSFQCPVCGSYLKIFLSHVSGGVSRPDADCPVCLSSERHRLAWLYFVRKTNLFKARLTMLHIGPEPEIKKNLSVFSNLTYITADLNHNNVSTRMDIALMPFKSNSWDVIYCSHVLNAIPYDTPAISELYRVLNQEGWLLLQVPVTGSEYTEESPSLDDRIARYKDAYIFRRYGLDIKKKLENAGFNVVEDRFFDSLENDEKRKYGLKDEKLYICTKSSSR